MSKTTIALSIVTGSVIGGLGSALHDKYLVTENPNGIKEFSWWKYYIIGEREGDVYSGLNFNKYHKNNTFYKITNAEERHYGFQYKDGLNVDTNPFDPHGSCLPGGLYFADKNRIGNFAGYGVNVRKVEVPDDALVYVDRGKYKADKIILKKKTPIRESELCDDKNFRNQASLQGVILHKRGTFVPTMEPGRVD